MRLKLSPICMTLMILLEIFPDLFVFFREEQQEPMALTLTKPSEEEKRSVGGIGEGVVNGIISNHLNSSHIVTNHATNMVLNSQPTDSHSASLDINQPTNLVTGQEENLVNGESMLKQEVEEEMGTSEVKQEEQVVEQVPANNQSNFPPKKIFCEQFLQTRNHRCLVSWGNRRLR